MRALLSVGSLPSFFPARHRPVRAKGTSERFVELLGQRDDDAGGAADVAEPVDVLVLIQLADQLTAVGVQARHDVIDVVGGEHSQRGRSRSVAGGAGEGGWCGQRGTHPRAGLATG
jgi:hypothetical protein